MSTFTNVRDANHQKLVFPQPKKPAKARFNYLRSYGKYNHGDEGRSLWAEPVFEMTPTWCHVKKVIDENSGRISWKFVVVPQKEDLAGLTQIDYGVRVGIEQYGSVYGKPGFKAAEPGSDWRSLFFYMPDDKGLIDKDGDAYCRFSIIEQYSDGRLNKNYSRFATVKDQKGNTDPVDFKTLEGKRLLASTFFSANNIYKGQGLYPQYQVKSVVVLKIEDAVVDTKKSQNILSYLKQNEDSIKNLQSSIKNLTVSNIDQSNVLFNPQQMQQIQQPQQPQQTFNVSQVAPAPTQGPMTLFSRVSSGGQPPIPQQSFPQVHQNTQQQSTFLQQPSHIQQQQYSQMGQTQQVGQTAPTFSQGIEQNQIPGGQVNNSVTSFLKPQPGNQVAMTTTKL